MISNTIDAFALDRMIGEASEGNQRALASLRTEMKRSATVDPTSGAVQLKPAKIRTALRTRMDLDAADRFTNTLADTTAGGMVLYGTDPKTGVAVPRRVLDHMNAYSASLRAPSSPFTSESLARRPIEIGEHGNGETDTPPDTDGKDDGQTGPITIPKDIPAAIEEAEAVARCLLHGTWTGWWDGWSGWIPGFKVHLDHDCADRLANVMMGAGGAGLAADALKALVKAGVAAAIKTVASAAALVLPLIGYLLALNIKAVNWAKGTALLCSWPWTGGIVFWAAAG